MANILERLGITDATILAIVSGSGYIYAYWFNNGFASHFGYPADLFGLPTYDIVFAISGVIATLATSLLLWQHLSGKLAGDEHGRNWAIAILLAILLLVAFIKVIFPRDYGLIVACTTFILVAADLFLLPFILRKGWIRRGSPDTRLIIPLEDFRSKMIAAMFLFIFIIPFGWAVGASNAASVTTFYYFQKEGVEYVIVKMDSEKVLCQILAGSKIRKSSFVLFPREAIMGINIGVKKKDTLEWE
jgi:hypothetical protein